MLSAEEILSRGLKSADGGFRNVVWLEGDRLCFDNSAEEHEPGSVLAAKVVALVVYNYENSLSRTDIAHLEYAASTLVRCGEVDLAVRLGLIAGKLETLLPR